MRSSLHWKKPNRLTLVVWCAMWNKKLFPNLWRVGGAKDSWRKHLRRDCRRDDRLPFCFIFLSIEETCVIWGWWSIGSRWSLLLSFRKIIGSNHWKREKSAEKKRKNQRKRENERITAASHFDLLSSSLSFSSPLSRCGRWGSEWMWRFPLIFFRVIEVSFSFFLFPFLFYVTFFWCPPFTSEPQTNRITKKKVDFSNVILKLVSPTGVVIEETECSPSGYYFLPIYHDGKYSIEIQGPVGWSIGELLSFNWSWSPVSTLRSHASLFLLLFFCLFSPSEICDRSERQSMQRWQRSQFWTHRLPNHRKSK